MFKLRVVKVRDGVETRSAEVTTSVAQAALDHLHASTARYGFEALHRYDSGRPEGDLIRNGKVVGYWEMEEVSA